MAEISDVYFIDGMRTPFGRAGEKGMYWNTRADDLVVKTIRGVIERNPDVPLDRIDDVAIAATTQEGDQGLTLGRTAAILARDLGADVLVVLTDVDAVYHGWGTPAQAPIPRLTAAEAEALAASGALDEGGMKPKVQAAAAFVRGGGARAVIARLSDGPAALRGITGTTITGDA